MSSLNNKFFDEFKNLDKLCREIYGKTTDNKLGVTLYLEDMDRKAYQGVFKVSGWTSDYNQLKSVRNMRNQLAHSLSFSVDMCSQEDIDFVCLFRARILNQTDPIALLRKQTTCPRPSSTPKTQQQSQRTQIYTSPSKTPSGCLGVVASFFIVLACFIAFLL